jgi:hypothetical protein
MAEDVLGITGLVNIDDIQKTFDKLIGDLERLGVSTDEISARMTKALNDIANSSEKDLAAKTTAAMKILNEAIAETNSNLRSTPEMIKNAEQEATRLQNAVSKLENELGKTVVGSKEFDALNKQLENERETLRLQTADVEDMKAAHEQAAQTVRELQGIYDNFIATLKAKGNAEQEATEAANTEATAQEQAAQSTQDVTQATREQSQAQEEAANATRKHTDATKEQASSQKQIQAAIEDTQKTIDELVSKQEKAQKRMESLRKNMQDWAKLGMEGGYVTQKGEGQYKADPKAAGYNENVVAHMQKIAKEYNALKKSLQEYRDEETLARQGLKELQISLQEVEQQTNQNTDANERTKQSSPRQMLMELRNEMTMLTLQWREMTNAERESAEGQALKHKLDELQAKAAKLQDAFGDVQETIKNDANDTAAFSALTQGLNLVISGFGAAEGAAAAFGMSEEDLARAQTMIQGSLAATNFLTETQNALQSQSALMRGINTLQTLAAAKAQDIETAAKGRGIIATKAATVAQAAFNLVAKANPYVLLATAILTVVGALAAFAIGSKKAKEKEEEMQRVQEREKEFYDTYHNTLATTIDKYRQLESAYKKLKTAKEKTKWIKDNTDKFHELGFELKGIEDTERVFAGNTDAIIKAFDLRARAAAYAAKITKTYNDALLGQDYKVGDKLSESEFKKLFPEWNASPDGHIYSPYTNLVGGIFSDDLYLTQKGVDELNRRALDAAEKETSRLREIKNGLEEEANNLLANMGVSSYDPNSGGGTTDKPGKPTKDEPKYKSAAELNDELLQLTKERIDRELELEKEGTKRWEQLQRERISIQAEIDRRAAQKAGNEAIADLDASYKGGKSGLNEQQYNERREKLQQQTSQLLAAITAKEQQDIADLSATRIKAEQQQEDELVAQYQSYIDRKKKIDADYQKALQDIDKAIAQAQERGDTERVEALQRSRAQAAQQHNEQLANLSLQQLKETPDYVRAFEDLANTSTETLKSLITKFEAAKEAAAKNLQPHELREYTQTLQQMYDELESRNPFDALIKSMQELADAQKEVKSAQDILNAVKAGNVIINEQTGNAYTEDEATKKLLAAKDKEAKIYSKLTKNITACTDRLNSFANTLSKLGDMVGGKLGDTLNAVGGMLGSLGSAFDNLKNINVNATGFEKAFGQFSAVAGTVMAMVDMNRQLDSLLPDQQSIYEHYARKQAEINKRHQQMIELEIAQLEERLNSESWFYENGLTQLKKNAELNKEYARAYGEIAAAPQEIYQEASSGFSKWAPAIIGAIVGIIAGVVTFGAGTGAGAALGAAIGTAVGGTAIGAALGSTVIAAIGTAIFSGVGAALGNAVRAGIDGITYNEGQTAAINNMRVQTRHKTFFRSEKTQDLQSWVKENWGQDLFEDVKGVSLIDPEVAKKLLEDGPTLVGETRETLESLLEYSEKIRDFIEDVHNYVSEAFSPLTDNLTDALWDWLAEGTDVMDSFREYAADTFKNIAQDALKAMMTKSIFEPYQEQLENLTIAYSTGQIDETAYMAGVAEFAKQAQSSIEAQLPLLQNAAEVMQMAMQGAGIDIVGKESYQQQGSSGAWQSLGEDTGQELNGRFTALQITGESLLVQSIEQTATLMAVQQEIVLTRTEIVTMSSNVDTIRETQEDMLSTLEQIQRNTFQLHEIKEDIKLLVENTKNI